MTNVTEAIVENAEVLALYARKLTQDRDAARDLCQDTLFKALANRASFHCGTDVRPWLFTIMRNLFINNYQRKKLEKRLFSHGSREIAAYADASTHAFTTTNIELKEVQSIIYTMPAILRTSIHLYCQGYKYQEIAAITRTAIGTTKSRIHMARKLLRKRTNSDLHHSSAA